MAKKLKMLKRKKKKDYLSNRIKEKLRVDGYEYHGSVEQNTESVDRLVNVVSLLLERLVRKDIINFQDIIEITNEISHLGDSDVGDQSFWKSEAEKLFRQAKA